MRLAPALVASALLASSCACSLVGRVSEIRPRYDAALWRTQPPAPQESAVPVTRVVGASRFHASDDLVDLDVDLATQVVVLDLTNRGKDELRLDSPGVRATGLDGREGALVASVDARRRVTPPAIPPGGHQRVRLCRPLEPAGEGDELWCDQLAGGPTIVEGSRASARERARTLIGREVVVVVPLVAGSSRVTYTLHLTMTGATVTRRWYA